MTLWFLAFLGQEETFRSLLLVHEKKVTEMEKLLETFKSTWHCCDSKCMISGLFHWIGCGPVWVNGEWCVTWDVYQSLEVECVLVCDGLEIKGKMGSLPQIARSRASLLVCRTQITGVSSYCALCPCCTWERPGEAWDQPSEQVASGQE